ncbi:hypothetical protein GGI04_006169, partial [Coemansia thaxteri]
MVVGDSVFAGVVKGTANVKESATSAGFLQTAGSDCGSFAHQPSKNSHSRKRPAAAGTVTVLQGEALFSSSALPFKVGTYEMRLHHGGTHAVLAQSKPFEIIVCDAKDIVDMLGDKEAAAQRDLAGGAVSAAESDGLDGLALALLTVINRMFAVTDSHVTPTGSQGSLSSDPPDDVSVQTDVVEPLESIGDAFSVDEVLDEKQARRLGYAIKEYFGVEFSSD